MILKKCVDFTPSMLPLLEHFAKHVLDLMRAACGRAHTHTGSKVRHSVRCQSGHAYCLVRGNGGVDGHLGHVPAFLAINPLGIHFRHTGRHGRAQSLHFRKHGTMAHGRLSLHQGLPHDRHAAAKRRNRPKTRDHDPLLCYMIVRTS